MSIEIEPRISKIIRKVCNLGFKILPKYSIREILTSRVYTYIYCCIGDRVHSYEKLFKDIEPYGEMILDVGVGPGKIYRTKYEKSNVIIGVDFSLEMLKKLKDLKPEAQVILADGRYLPFVSDSFDISVANEVLKYSDEPQRIVEEMKRVSRKKVVYTEGFIISRRKVVDIE